MPTNGIFVFMQLACLVQVMQVLLRAWSIMKGMTDCVNLCELGFPFVFIDNRQVLSRDGPQRASKKIGVFAY